MNRCHTSAPLSTARAQRLTQISTSGKAEALAEAVDLGAEFGRNRITVYPDRPLGVGEGTSIQQNYWFRLVDVESGKGIVWFHPIPSDLDYHADKPFFHTFSGCVRVPISAPDLTG